VAEVEPVAAAEAWFLRHGLPYFVDDVRHEVLERLSRGRIVTVLGVGAVLGIAIGVGIGRWTTSASVGITTAVSVLLLWFALYALYSLKAGAIAKWALRRAFGSLGLLLPLATRALPMLLLFITFLFINTEVWQVASALHGGVLWGSVLFFALAAIGFLVPRLAEELDQFDDSIHADDLLDASRGTPLEAAAQDLVDGDIDLPEEAQVSGLQMVNLVIVLVVAQAVQVLLLALAVFLFFIVFGAVAIQDSVIETWIGYPAHYPPGPDLVSVELIRVSTFLAGFAGLYFTVVAITDELYRKEFFTVILGELERAVGARVVYRELRRRLLAVPDADGDPLAGR
jgi:hypothetical protein